MFIQLALAWLHQQPRSVPADMDRCAVVLKSDEVLLDEVESGIFGIDHAHRNGDLVFLGVRAKPGCEVHGPTEDREVDPVAATDRSCQDLAFEQSDAWASG